MEPLMTVDEAGGVLGLGRSAMYELLSSGELLSIKVGGRMRRIRPDDLREYVERQAAAASAGRPARAAV